ncbi:hypothetical protein DFH06DRAFT_1137742 [Mycena polygramma]|nr:hypothetical protein DFH06DRAFT_1143080 [Mycena polygramma]KAJ7640263.1 hypothetical protein DFH06DRAFT_1137742 [Mycena polygramma]
MRSARAKNGKEEWRTCAVRDATPGSPLLSEAARSKTRYRAPYRGFKAASSLHRDFLVFQRSTSSFEDVSFLKRGARRNRTCHECILPPPLHLCQPLALLVHPKKRTSNNFNLRNTESEETRIAKNRGFEAPRIFGHPVRIGGLHACAKGAAQMDSGTCALVSKSTGHPERPHVKARYGVLLDFDVIRLLGRAGPHRGEERFDKCPGHG